MNIEPGVLIAESYRIIKLLGQGGTGSVYLAFEEKLNRQVALKIMRNWLKDSASLSEDDNAKRFLREAQALSKLRYPSIVQVYRFGFLEDKSPFVAMEYVEGSLLREVILNEKTLACRKIFDIASDLARGLSFAHSQGIIHRDLKPENIIVSKSDDKYFAKLLDFGLCKEESKADITNYQLTRTGMLVGTPAYMSPEQCMGKFLGPSSDIYSFGYILYEMLTGLPPFQTTNYPELIQKHLLESLPDLATFPGAVNLPPELIQIIEKCTKKKSEERYQSFDELLQDMPREFSQSLSFRLDYEQNFRHVNAINEKIAKTAQNKDNKYKFKVTILVIGILFFALLFSLTFSSTRRLVTEPLLSALGPEKSETLLEDCVARLIDLQMYDAAFTFVEESQQWYQVRSWSLSRKCRYAYKAFTSLKDKLTPDKANLLAYKIFMLTFQEFLKTRQILHDGKSENDKYLLEMSKYLYENCKDQNIWTRINDVLICRVSGELQSRQIIDCYNCYDLPDFLRIWCYSFLRKRTRLNQASAAEAISAFLETAESGGRHNRWNWMKDYANEALKIAIQYKFLVKEAQARVYIALASYHLDDKNAARAEFAKAYPILKSDVTLDPGGVFFYSQLVASLSK